MKEDNSGSIMINSFQLCRKQDIVQETIEMQMKIMATCAPSEDDSEDSEDTEDIDFMSRCQSLSYNIEIGENHERDKFNWVVNKTGKSGGSGLTDKKYK